MMKLKHLESELSGAEVFNRPKIELEQIPTSAHIAACMIHNAAQNDDISERMIGDFGVGTGILSMAASLMGSHYGIGVDVDQDALEIARRNFDKFDIDNVDLLYSDVQTLSINPEIDTVVMNPPFGTRNAGVDTAFLQKAMDNASVVYSLHKTSTRDHFVRLSRSSEWSMEVVAEVRYEIKKTFKHHKDKSRDVEVDIYRFTHTV